MAVELSKYGLKTNLNTGRNYRNTFFKKNTGSEKLISFCQRKKPDGQDYKTRGM